MAVGRRAPSPPLVFRKFGAEGSRTIRVYFSCIQEITKSSKVIKNVAYAMATHFCPKFALKMHYIYWVEGGGGFPYKVNALFPHEGR